MDTEPSTSRTALKEPGYGPKISIAGIIIGMLWASHSLTLSPVAGSIHTTGTVVEQEIAPKGICSPIAELVVDGLAYRTRPGFGAEPCEHELGDAIEVTYHPDNISRTLEIPYDEKQIRQLILIAVPGWALLIASSISLLNNIRYRLKKKRSRA
jgi:hypothetical protein